MADDKSKITDTSNASNATESPLLSILSSIGSSSNSSGGSGGQEFDLSSILSNGTLSATTAATRSVGLSASATTTSHPIDSDIDQLMKSLSGGGAVDTTGKVTNDDLDKILGSIGMGFSSGTPVAGLSTTSASNGDPLEALSRDFGIDLKPTAGTLAPTMSATPLTPNALEKGRSNSQLQSKSRAVSMSSMPNASGVNSSTVTAQPIQDKQNKPVGGPTPASTPMAPNQQQKPISTTTTTSATAKLQTIPQKTQSATRPSPVAGGGPHQPSPHVTPRPYTPSQNSNTPRPQTPQPLRPSRPSTPRPVIPAARTPTASGQQRPVGSPSGSNNPSRSGSPKPQGKQNIYLNQRPVARPMPRPAAAAAAPGSASTPTTDPSKWLAATMSTLPSNQQERLSGLFRGLQAKTIPFQAFAKDAEAIMGPKFHELLALMRNQGPRHAHPAINAQQQHTVGRSSPRPNVQANNAMAAAGGGARPNQGMSSLQTPESNKNLAMMRQLLMQQHHQNSSSGSGEQLNSTSGAGLGDMSSLTQTLGMRQLGGNQQLPGNEFETVINRWRQVIVNPKISAEQLSVLSMQLHAYGEMIANANGPMASVPEEVQREQFGQVSKLQTLISQRQQSSRSGGAPMDLSSAGGSTADKRFRDTQRKDSIGSGKQIKPMKRAGSVTPRSGSPAPHMLAKRQRTGGDETGPDSDADMPGGSGSSSSYMGHSEPYVEIERPSSHVFLMNRHPISRTSTAGTSNGDDNDMRADIHKRPRGLNPAVGGGAGNSGGNNDAFSLDDVMGYAGVDLREESEVIIGSTPQGGGYPGRRRYGEPVGGSSGDRYSGVPRVTTRAINGVEVNYNRSLDNGFVNAPVMETMVAKICRKMHLRAVSPDAIPYLVLALQERLRGFMELASAAAHHRTRTQTLPPPPLDPVTRHPLYKIKPHLDVKKQLAVLERADQLTEQRRQRVLSEREQRNSMDAVPEGSGEANGGDDGSGDRANEGFTNQATVAAAGGGDGAEPVKKRGRKREDSSASETASYTAKNMPDDVRNKISNETALRAAGGFRKSWMSSSSADWMMATSGGTSMTSRVSGTKTATNTVAPLQQPHPLSGTSGPQTPNFAHVPAGLGNATQGQHHFQHNHRSSFGGASDFNAGARVDSPAPGSTMSAQISSFGRPPSMVPQRSANFSAPLMLTVRDCLFSLERERLGGVRVGRGGGDRVLIQAYMKYLHD